ncbi:hypothetical protein PTTG_05348 [Puccinia triticina 1-1 BBBD Race 1]|uniref:C2H2-type domain-containing protein n=1 Tax=Puccinia triticina (isolate 1-1 / race 1 (BBBD)) TaxID=630390 RepID=A0A180H161_PUCT1|nr:hypothetical protein PTTG_05348 [Puccinia triticina 1-1 BBBD Race 1]
MSASQPAEPQSQATQVLPQSEPPIQLRTEPPSETTQTGPPETSHALTEAAPQAVPQPEVTAEKPDGKAPQDAPQAEVSTAKKAETNPDGETPSQALTQAEVNAESKPEAVSDGKTPKAVPQIEVSSENQPEAITDDATPQAVPTEKTAEAAADDKAEAVPDDQAPPLEASQPQGKIAILCKPCHRQFHQETHYVNHLIHSPRHFYCKPCNRDFASDEAKQAHLVNAKVHKVCKWCKDVEIENLKYHNTWYHEECTRCKKTFENHEKFHAHCRAVHSKIYCESCYRMYKNRNDLKMHSLSHCHQYRSFTCPSAECRALFLSESGVVAHLESGSCTSGADQAMIDKSMVIQDPKQVFVRQARVALPQERAIPAGQKINPCPLCPKKFRHRAGLLQHLASSKHTNNGRDPYKCPAATCNKPTFPSLSSLLGHKERGKCGLDKDTAKIALLDRHLFDLFDRIRNM